MHQGRAVGAYEIGLINHVVESDQLMSKAMEIAYAIVNSAPLSVVAARQVVQIATEMGKTAALDQAYEIFKPVYESEDAREGARAFREKRSPKWLGR
ncbi:hypothetical protein H0A65_15010 [Alcaligenaceae bacterium]|nr:hypothetical protein [Alcaligenaceae bacterium]